MSRCATISIALIAVFGITALAVVLFKFDPEQHAFYPKCLLHSLTGLNCAGCGSLRATHHLLRGELTAAFRSNSLLVLMGVLPIVVCIRWLRGESPARLFQRFFSHPALAWIFLVTILTFTILRNLPLPAFAWMRP
jgi:hypothetical protein